MFLIHGILMFPRESHKLFPVKLALFFSAVLYILSLFLVVFFTIPVGSPGKPGVVVGYEVLVFGWLGILGGIPGWYANASLLFTFGSFLRARGARGGWLCKMFVSEVPGKPEEAHSGIVTRRTRILAWFTIVLTLSSFFTTHWGVGSSLYIKSFGLGFYLWVSAMLISCSLILLRLRHWSS